MWVTIYESLSLELKELSKDNKDKNVVRVSKPISNDFFMSKKIIENSDDVLEYVKDIEKKLLELVKNQNIIIK